MQKGKSIVEAFDELVTMYVYVTSSINQPNLNLIIESQKTWQLPI